MKFSRKAVGRALYLVRDMNNLTLVQVAEITGSTKSSVSRVEQGQADMPWQEVDALLKHVLMPHHEFLVIVANMENAR